MFQLGVEAAAFNGQQPVGDVVDVLRILSLVEFVQVSPRPPCQRGDTDLRRLLDDADFLGQLADLVDDAINVALKVSADAGEWRKTIGGHLLGPFV